MRKVNRFHMLCLFSLVPSLEYDGRISFGPGGEETLSGDSWLWLKRPEGTSKDLGLFVNPDQ